MARDCFLEARRRSFRLSPSEERKRVNWLKASTKRLRSITCITTTFLPSQWARPVRCVDLDVARLAMALWEREHCSPSFRMRASSHTRFALSLRCLSPTVRRHRHPFVAVHWLLWMLEYLSLIHISEPTRLGMISYAVF